jgi:hypothetical protein
MDAKASEVVSALRRLVDANEDACRALTRANSYLIESIGRIEAGEDVQATLLPSMADPLRADTKAAIEDIVSARHVLRLQVVAACTAAGTPPREIAKHWNVSRQRVDQFIQELRRTDASTND